MKYNKALESLAVFYGSVVNFKVIQRFKIKLHFFYSSFVKHGNILQSIIKYFNDQVLSIIGLNPLYL